jgi:hypothetical protein
MTCVDKGVWVAELTNILEESYLVLAICSCLPELVEIVDDTEVLHDDLQEIIIVLELLLAVFLRSTFDSEM